MPKKKKLNKWKKKKSLKVGNLGLEKAMEAKRHRRIKTFWRRPVQTGEDKRG